MEKRHQRGRWVHDARAVGVAAVCSAGILLGGCAGKGAERRGAGAREGSEREVSTTAETMAASAPRRAGRLSMLTGQQEIHVKTEFGGHVFEYLISEIDDGDGAFYFPEAWEGGGFANVQPWKPANHPQLGEWRHKSGTVLITVKNAPPQVLVMREAGVVRVAEAEAELPGRWAPGRSRRINVTGETADADIKMEMVEKDDDDGYQAGKVLEKITVTNGTITVWDPYELNEKKVSNSGSVPGIIEVRWTGVDNSETGRKIYTIVVTKGIEP